MTATEAPTISAIDLSTLSVAATLASATSVASISVPSSLLVMLSMDARIVAADCRVSLRLRLTLARSGALNSLSPATRLSVTSFAVLTISARDSVAATVSSTVPASVVSSAIVLDALEDESR